MLPASLFVALPETISKVISHMVVWGLTGVSAEGIRAHEVLQRGQIVHIASVPAGKCLLGAPAGSSSAWQPCTKSEPRSCCRCMNAL